MENKLEQLLNSLIEKGWKPRGEEEIKSCQIGESFYKRKFIEDMVGFYIDDRGTPQWLFTKSLREVCSKSSGLWQFVCENGMIKKEGNSEWTIIYPNERIGDYQKCHSYCKGQSEYWILESSLKDESELESFILDNVKVDE